VLNQKTRDADSRYFYAIYTSVKCTLSTNTWVFEQPSRTYVHADEKDHTQTNGSRWW